MPGWRGWVECEVLEIEPPRRMVWAWFPTDDDVRTLVTFELEVVNGGTRLKLTHKGVTEPVIAELLRGGWPTRLAELARVLSAPARSA